jgi:16S rRNA (cytidine1402-2'-O)-methyltransferase
MLELLAEGADIAYVSDAGSPGISDPGSKIARDVRSAGFEVVPIPGPSAVTALLSVSGLAGRGWFFEGFLPPKGRKRLTRIEELVAREEPFALYESPHRIGKLFSELTAAAADWSGVVGRELTKMHEQITVGRVDEIAELVGTSDIPARGEFVVLVWRRKSR